MLGLQGALHHVGQTREPPMPRHLVGTWQERLAAMPVNYHCYYQGRTLLGHFVVDVDPTVLLGCRQVRFKGRPHWPRGSLRCSWCQPVHVCPAPKSPSKLLACIRYAVHASLCRPCRGPWAGWYDTWTINQNTKLVSCFCCIFLSF